MSPIDPIRKEEKNESWHRNCLAVFPTDVLNMITGYVNGFSILALYNCGSGLLNYKLRKNGAVTHFRVVCGKDVLPPYRDWRHNNFRALTIYRSLRSVELVGFSGYCLRYFTSAVVADLPPTIEILRFEFIEALTMWVDTKRKPERVTKGIEFEPFHLDECFPKLQVLELQSHVWDRLTIYEGRNCTAYNWVTELKDRFLLHIPRTLHTVAIQSTGSNGFGQNLPEDLVSLNLSFSNPSNDLPNLPKNLRSLKLKCWAEITSQDISILPRTLEHLTIASRFTNFNRDDGNRGNNDGQEDLGVPEFPPHLQSLVFDTNNVFLDEKIIKALPSTLTILRMDGCHNGLTSSCVQYFPRSLTILELANAPSAGNSIDTDAFMDLPSGLRSLNLATAVHLPWSVLEMLPSSLELFTQYSMKFAEIPDQPDATREQAEQYWRNKAPASCILQVNRFQAE